MPLATWLASTVESLTDGRVCPASRNSWCHFIRILYWSAMPKELRRRMRASQASCCGQCSTVTYADAQRRRDLLWSILQDEEFPLEGGTLAQRGVARLPSLAATAKCGRSAGSTVPPRACRSKRRGCRPCPLERLIGTLENKLLVDEVATALPAWLESCTGATVGGIAAVLNSMINLATFALMSRLDVERSMALLTRLRM